MSKYYGTEISPTCFNMVGSYNYGKDSMLRENYCKRIAKHFKVHPDMLNEVLRTCYGRNWEQTPYKQLAKVAKTLPKTKVPTEYYTLNVMPKHLWHMFERQYVTIEDTYAYRIAVRRLGKKNVLAHYRKDENKSRASELAAAVRGYDIMVRVRGKAEARQYKSNPRLLERVYNTFKSYSTTWRTHYDMRDAMPDDMAETFYKLAEEVAVLDQVQSYDTSSYTSYANRVLNSVAKWARIKIDYERDGTMPYGSTPDSVENKLAQAITSMYQLQDTEKMLGEIGLCYDKHRRGSGFYRNTTPRIHPKYVRTLKAIVADKKSSLTDKQIILDSITDTLRREQDMKGRTDSWIPYVMVANNNK